MVTGQHVGSDYTNYRRQNVRHAMIVRRRRRILSTVERYVKRPAPKSPAHAVRQSIRRRVDAGWFDRAVSRW